jgi:DnaJ-class molecular chaperone
MFDQDAINNMVMHLNRHKNLQIDVDRKIFKRLDKLEDYMKMEDRITASDVLLRLNEVQTWIMKHEKEGQEYGNELEERNKKITNQLSQMNISLNYILSDLEVGYRNKKPHKCPVCDGAGMTNCLTNSFIKYDEKNVICKSCEGKGIVWG